MTDWTLLDSETVVDSPWMRVRRNHYRRASGAEVDDYYVVERSDFVLVVAIRDGRLVLVRQYRPASGRDYVSLPAGYLDEGETPEQAAARELREETGLVAEEVERIGELHPLPGYLRSRAFVVLCREPEGELEVGDPEEIEEVFERPVDEVLARIRAGDLQEMQLVAALLLALARSEAL